MQWFYWVPKKTMSTFMGWLADCRCRYWSRWMIGWYKNYFKVDLSSAKISDISGYRCFNDFFIRELKPGLRPLANDSAVISSPCDGAISQIGMIEAQSILQAKGQSYRLSALCAQRQDWVETFSEGHFLTTYLSPKDYHRLHMPFSGQLQEMVFVPGQLFPVFPRAVSEVGGLFARNERVISVFNTEIGRMAVIMIGALNVGSISVQWHGRVKSKHHAMATWKYTEQDIRLERGDEMGYFKMGGSAVIVLFEAGKVQWQDSLVAETPVLMGQTIGRFCSV